MMKNFVDDCLHLDVKNFVDDTHKDRTIKKSLVTNISVCVAIKNRTMFVHNDVVYHPFKNFVTSLTHLNRHKFNIELVVADFYSDDVKLESWIYDEIKHVELKIVKVKADYFSRGLGLNMAAANAKYDILFLTDADMIANNRVVERGVFHVKHGKTFFPIAAKHVNEKKKVVRWFQSGTGNVIISKGMYNAMGKVPEYNKWGKEDKKFYDTMIYKVKDVVRERIKGFFHQWHPEVLRHQYSQH